MNVSADELAKTPGPIEKIDHQVPKLFELQLRDGREYVMPRRRGDMTCDGRRAIVTSV